MATTHQVTDDIVYDLVSIQYHALQAVESYDKYLGDAHREQHEGITKFIEECRQQDARAGPALSRAPGRSHDLSRRCPARADARRRSVE
jgi:hypothetical protein